MPDYAAKEDFTSFDQSQNVGKKLSCEVLTTLWQQARHVKSVTNVFAFHAHTLTVTVGLDHFRHPHEIDIYFIRVIQLKRDTTLKSESCHEKRG